MSLAIDLWDGAAKVPEELAKKMRQCGSKTDRVFLKIKHDLGPGGKGFVDSVHTHTLEILDYSKGVWKAGYGTGNDANFANLCLLRWRQVKLDGYRKLILDTADRYLDSRPDLTIPVQPRTLGDVIFLMLGAHEITGRSQYLDSAERFSREAIRIYFDDGSPLPRATSKHDHYEAITLGDTLMMGLLKLWVLKNRPEMKLRLVYSDR